MTAGAFELALRWARIALGMARAGLEAFGTGTIRLLRELALLVFRGLTIVRARGAWIVSSCLAAGVLCVVAYLGISPTIALVAATFFLGVAAAATVGSETKTSLLVPSGVMVVVAALPCVGAVLVGARLAAVHGETHYDAGWALFLGLTFLGTFVLLPLLEAAPRAVVRRLGPSDALASALVATGRRGLLRTLIVGLVAGAAVAIVPLLDVLGPSRLVDVEVGSHELPTLVGIAGGGAAASWAILVVLSGALATEVSATRERSRSAFTFIAVGIALLCAGTLAGATLLPAPLMRPLPPEVPVLSAVPPPPGVHVRIEHEDGGSFLVLRSTSSVTVVDVGTDDHVHVVGNAHRYWALVGSDWGSPYAGGIPFDVDGRRLDDGPLDRIRAHVGGPAAIALALSALAIAAALWRSRKRARLHRAVRRGKESIVSGRLRGEDLPPATVANGVASTIGWQLEAHDGSALVALPIELPFLGGEPTGTLTDGQEMELVLADPVRTFAFRDGAARCPDGAALVAPGAPRLDELVGTWALAPAGALLAASSVAAIAGAILTLGGGAWLEPLLPAVESADTVTASDIVSGSAAAPAGVVYSEDLAASRRVRLSESGYRTVMHVVSATETEIAPRVRTELVSLGGLIVSGSGAMRVSVVRGSLLDVLGFQNGDTVRAIAGVPVGDWGEAHRVLTANATSTAFAIRVERSGAPVDLVFRTVETVWP